jgi:DNA-binding NarL/FixJ family response regulator
MTTTHKSRILVVDDQEIIRRGLRIFLELSPKWLICREAANGREATAVAPTVNPDVILMDISMPDVNGIEATRQIRKTLPETPILMLSMHDRRGWSTNLFGRARAATC